MYNLPSLVLCEDRNDSAGKLSTFKKEVYEFSVWKEGGASRNVLLMKNQEVQPSHLPKSSV